MSTLDLKSDKSALPSSCYWLMSWFYNRSKNKADVSNLHFFLQKIKKGTYLGDASLQDAQRCLDPISNQLRAITSQTQTHLAILRSSSLYPQDFVPTRFLLSVS